MPRLVLRSGFLAVPSPEGGGRIVHVRTDDALVVSAEDFAVLARAGEEAGLADDEAGVGPIVERFRGLQLLVPRPAPPREESFSSERTEVQPAPSATVTTPAYRPTPEPIPEAVLEALPDAAELEPLLSWSSDSVADSAAPTEVQPAMPGTLPAFPAFKPLDGTGAPGGAPPPLPVTSSESLVLTVTEEDLGPSSATTTVSPAIAAPAPWSAEAPSFSSRTVVGSAAAPEASTVVAPAVAPPAPWGAEAPSFSSRTVVGSAAAPEAQAAATPEASPAELTREAPALAPAPAAPPPAARSSGAGRWAAAALGLVVIGAGGYLAWTSLQPAAPASRPVALPPPVVKPPPVEPPADTPAVVADDAGAVAEAPAGDAGTSMPEAPDAGALAAAPLGGEDAGAAVEDAGAAVAVVAAVPDAGPPPAVAVVAADAGALAVDPVPPTGAEASEWLEVKIVNRGRVSMAQVLAPSDGVVSWLVAAEQRVKRGQVLGRLAPSGGGPAQDLVSGQGGLLAPEAAEGAAVKAAQTLASIIYFEAYLRGVVTGVKPDPTWRCEVSSAQAAQSAPCKVTVTAPRGAGLLVTAVTEPRWFDTATDAVLRLAPPK